jgi:2Fe-2S ferredoxin
MPKINIPQKNLIFEVERNANLMASLLSHGLPVASSCNGDGICSKCKVKIAGLINQAETLELETLKRNKCEPDERLSCQIGVTDDLTIRAKYW